MAKTMARLNRDTVINLEWCADSEKQTENLKDIGSSPVGIGDTFENGKWYRDGEEVLPPLEKRIRDLEKENADLKSAFEIMGGTV